MSTPTPKGIPVPDLTDPNNVVGAIAGVANWVDQVPGIASMSRTQMLALTGSARWIGRVVFDNNPWTGGLRVWDGGTWQPVHSGAAAVEHVTLAWTSGSGPTTNGWLIAGSTMTALQMLPATLPDWVSIEQDLAPWRGMLNLSKGVYQLHYAVRFQGGGPDDFKAAIGWQMEIGSPPGAVFAPTAATPLQQVGGDVYPPQLDLTGTIRSDASSMFVCPWVHTRATNPANAAKRYDVQLNISKMA